VRVLAAVATGVNHATSPADVGGVPQYAGTSHAVDGLANTLVVTVPAWRDPGSLAQMQAYAADLLDSVKDACVEGQIAHKGLFVPALTMGLAASVAGAGFTTGWEGTSAAIVECTVRLPDSGEDWITDMKVSTRRAHYQAGAFLKPARTGDAWGAFDLGLG